MTTRKKYPKHDLAFTKKLMSKRGVKDEYDKLKDEFELLTEMLKARKAAGMTQIEVAKAMGVDTSIVGRLEASGGKKKHSPTLATLRRYANALGAKLEIRFIVGQE